MAATSDNRLQSIIGDGGGGAYRLYTAEVTLDAGTGTVDFACKNIAFVIGCSKSGTPEVIPEFTASGNTVTITGETGEVYSVLVLGR